MNEGKKKVVLPDIPAEVLSEINRRSEIAKNRISHDKQIEFERYEISEILAQNFDLNGEKWDASDFEWAAHCVQMEGYRKIYDDHQRQCTCYALGCQMAEELKKEVAREFIEAVDSMMECVVAMTGYPITYYGSYAELKKKYTESEKDK